MAMLFGQPFARHYWDGNRFVQAPMPPAQQPAMGAPAPQSPSVAPSLFQQQIGNDNNNGTNTVGGAPTSSAAAPAGFSSSGAPNRASSPSANGPSMASLGGLLGTGASLATGVLGLGTIGSAYGGYQDAKSLNADLATIGHGEKSVSPGAAAFSSALLGLPDAFGLAGPKTDVAAMDIGFSPRGVSEMAGFARGYDGMGLTGFDSLNMDAQFGALSPLSAATSPAGLLGGFFGGYNPAADLTGLGSPGLGGYGNLGTAHSYGMVDGQISGNFTGNETSGGTPGGTPGTDGSASVGDLGGPWRKGGYTGDDGDNKLEPKLGVVHEREYVIRPEATAYYGQGLLRAINERRIPRGMFR